MKTYWRTAIDPPGLLVEAKREVGDAPRPAFRSEWADRQHGLLSVRGEPRLWIDDPYRDGEVHVVVRDSRFAMQPLSIVPPITASTTRGMCASERDDVRATAWSKWFLRSLSLGRATPLYAGHWEVRFARAGNDPPWDYEGTAPAVSEDFAIVRMLRRMSRPRASLGTTDVFPIPYAGSEILPLRRLSAADTGRVKAFRKDARAGNLAPVFAIADTLIGAFLVLDGHTRLEAALEEGIDPPCLALFATHEVRGSTPRERSAVASLESLLVQNDRRVASYENINRAYAALYDNRPTIRARSRIFRMSGGLTAWDRLAPAAVRRAIAAENA